MESSFAINLGSALTAHLSVGDGPEAWGWVAATGVLGGLSYFFWRRLQATPTSASPRAEHPLSGAGPAAELSSPGAPHPGNA